MHKIDTPKKLASTDELGVPSGWDETTLQGLLDFVQGKGKFSHMGPGITTHPDAESLNRQAIHAAMLELERRKKVCRHYVGHPPSVTWMPKVARPDTSDRL